MALRNIVLEGNEILRKKCKVVEKFDDNLCDLLDDMYETMVKNGGVGIAAPQVGILKRIFIIEIDGLKMEFINPVIMNQLGSIIAQEGCLSVKNRNGYVDRPEQVTVRAFNRFGVEFELTISQWPARVICHEYDHLDGILYIDKVIENYKPKKR